MTTFAEEKFSEIHSELLPKIKSHWFEVTANAEKFEFDLQIEQYCKLEQMGVFKIYSARKDSVLVGYSAFFIFPSLKMKNVRVASAEGFWVEKSSRGMGSIALRLLRFTEQELKKLNITVIHANHPEEHGSLGRLLRLEGYTPHERTYVKCLISE